MAKFRGGGDINPAERLIQEMRRRDERPVSQPNPHIGERVCWRCDFNMHDEEPEASCPGCSEPAGSTAQVDLDALELRVMGDTPMPRADAMALISELRAARATIAAAVPCDAADKAVMRLPCDHANLRAKLAEQAATIDRLERDRDEARNALVSAKMETAEAFETIERLEGEIAQYRTLRRDPSLAAKYADAMTELAAHRALRARLEPALERAVAEGTHRAASDLGYDYMHAVEAFDDGSITGR